MSRIAIGLVGYFQFVRGYPIGPDLRERLQEIYQQGDEFIIKEMNWGPIAIVQDFQASTVHFDRIVLISAVDRGLESGAVKCRRWIGGKLDLQTVQERVFEAVTGIISLDNLLVIGEHFGIWPDELITVEAQLTDTAFGDLVMAEMEIHHGAGEISIVGQNPLAPDMERIMNNTYEMARRAALYGVEGLPAMETLGVSQLRPPADVCHNQLVCDSGIEGITPVARN